MRSPLIRRQVERIRQVSARCRRCQAAAAPILGLAIGLGIGILVLLGVQ